MRDENTEHFCLLFSQIVPRLSLISWASYQEGPEAPKAQSRDHGTAQEALL